MSARKKQFEDSVVIFKQEPGESKDDDWLIFWNEGPTGTANNLHFEHDPFIFEQFDDKLSVCLPWVGRRAQHQDPTSSQVPKSALLGSLPHPLYLSSLSRVKDSSVEHCDNRKSQPTVETMVSPVLRWVLWLATFLHPDVIVWTNLRETPFDRTVWARGRWTSWIIMMGADVCIAFLIHSLLNNQWRFGCSTMSARKKQFEDSVVIFKQEPGESKDDDWLIFWNEGLTGTTNNLHFEHDPFIFEQFDDKLSDWGLNANVFYQELHEKVLQYHLAKKPKEGSYTDTSTGIIRQG